jgi:hypothetical protein
MTTAQQDAAAEIRALDQIRERLRNLGPGTLKRAADHISDAIRTIEAFIERGT